jgi:RDD family
VSRVFRSSNTAQGASPGPLPRGTAPDRSYAGCMVRDADPASQGRVRGASLGLPATGRGSLASFGSRVGAFLIDALASSLIAGIFTAPRLPENWALLALAVIYVGSLVLLGQTPGMRLLGLRLAHPRQGQRLALWRAVVRTALLFLLVPALIVDADGRGLHDRLTDTAVVRDR